MYFYSKSVAEDRAKALEKEEGDHPRERGEVFLALERRKRARIRIAERRESRFIIKRNVLILLLYY